MKNHPFNPRIAQLIGQELNVLHSNKLGEVSPNSILTGSGLEVVTSYNPNGASIKILETSKFSFNDVRLIAKANSVLENVATNPDNPYNWFFRQNPHLIQRFAFYFIAALYERALKGEGAEYIANETLEEIEDEMSRVFSFISSCFSLSIFKGIDVKHIYSGMWIGTEDSILKKGYYFIIDASQYQNRFLARPKNRLVAFKITDGDEFYEALNNDVVDFNRVLFLGENNLCDVIWIPENDVFREYNLALSIFHMVGNNVIEIEFSELKAGIENGWDDENDAKNQYYRNAAKLLLESLMVGMEKATISEHPKSKNSLWYTPDYNADISPYKFYSSAMARAIQESSISIIVCEDPSCLLSNGELPNALCVTPQTLYSLMTSPSEGEAILTNLEGKMAGHLLSFYLSFTQKQGDAFKVWALHSQVAMTKLGLEMQKEEARKNLQSFNTLVRKSKDLIHCNNSPEGLFSLWYALKDTLSKWLPSEDINAMEKALLQMFSE